jgi:tetratricopeptide (TPR) repeat protein
MAAAQRGDAAAAKAAAEVIVALAAQPDRHPFAQRIILIQTAEAQALAAQAAGDTTAALAKMEEATALEDSISSLSQPPYPIIPAHELYGTMLLELQRPADARRHFEETLRRTPGRPKAVYGIARSAEALGDRRTAIERYTELLALWKRADHDRPELAAARRFLRKASATKVQ